MFHNFCHGHDGRGLKSISITNLLQGALLPLTSFHTVHRNNQSDHIHISLSLYDRQRLLNRGTCCSHVLNDHNFIAILNRASQQDSFVAVIFNLLAVAAIPDIFAILFRNSYGRCNGQRNTFVCRSKQHVKIQTELILDCLCIIFSQPLQLGTCPVKSCIHKKRRLSATLGHEIAKLQNVAVNHKLNKLFLILFHIFQPPY